MAPRKQKRVAARTKVVVPPPGSLVEAVRIQTIVEKDGTLIRGPTAIRAEWVDPEDMDRSKRTPRKVSGYRRTDALVGLQKRSDGKITQKHLDAADKLRDAYQIGVEGARPGQGRSFAQDAVMTGFAAGDYMKHDDRLGALQRYKLALRAVGPSLAGILVHVVLLNRDLAAWAKERKSLSGRELTSHDCRGYLIAGLDALVDHFYPMKGTR